jgi:hypothetical protein
MLLHLHIQLEGTVLRGSRAGGRFGCRNHPSCVHVWSHGCTPRTVCRSDRHKPHPCVVAARHLHHTRPPGVPVCLEYLRSLSNPYFFLGLLRNVPRSRNTYRHIFVTTHTGTGLNLPGVLRDMSDREEHLLMRTKASPVSPLEDLEPAPGELNLAPTAKTILALGVRQNFRNPISFTDVKSRHTSMSLSKSTTSYAPSAWKTMTKRPCGWPRTPSRMWVVADQRDLLEDTMYRRLFSLRVP